MPLHSSYSPVHPTDSPEGRPRQIREIGFLQFAPHRRSASENVRFIISSTKRLHHALVVLPEFFLGSYQTVPLFQPSQRDLQRILRPLLEYAELRSLRFIGTLPLATSMGALNRAVLLSHGEIRPLYDKVMLAGDEVSLFTPGATAYNLSADNALKFTVQVCLDVVDPLPVRAAVQRGAILLLGPAAVSFDYLRTIHRARALENQIVSVFCNRCGVDTGGASYLGRSAIFLPDGTALEAGDEDEVLVTARMTSAVATVETVRAVITRLAPGVRVSSRASAVGAITQCDESIL